MQAERVHTWCSIDDLGGGLAVRDDWEDEEIRPVRHRHQRRGRGRRRRREEPEFEEEQVPLTPEERAYQQARSVAEQKTKLTSELIWVSIIGIPLLLLFFPVGLFVIVFWGWRPAKRAYRLFMEPKLRERFIENEVEKQVHATLSHERRVLDTRSER